MYSDFVIFFSPPHSLSVNLLNAAKEVRAGTLRVMKHLIVDEESLQVLLDLHMDYFIARYEFCDVVIKS